ncbi:MAG: hypothetical protein KAQ90_07355 [Melioribacteraceae bacterium]|nr:hypothetical protein [Melioribacteraceae bacterium]
MERITKVEAKNILEKYFKLFVEKQKQSGYDVEIILAKRDKEVASHFYVRFNKGHDHSRYYKIMCA